MWEDVNLMVKLETNRLGDRDEAIAHLLAQLDTMLAVEGIPEVTFVLWTKARTELEALAAGG